MTDHFLYKDVYSHPNGKHIDIIKGIYGKR